MYQVKGLKKTKFQEEKFSDNLVQKLLEKLRKLRKSCGHKRNINGKHNEKLRYICFQQLLTLTLKTYDLRKLGNSSERKLKAQTTQSFCEKFNFIVILFKIAKKQP